MHNIVEALQLIVAKGAELVDCPASPPSRLQDWLGQREEVFGQLHFAEVQLAEEERQAVSLLSGKILGLDLKIFSRLENQLKDLGEELAAARRLKKILRNHIPAGARSFFQRAV